MAKADNALPVVVTVESIIEKTKANGEPMWTVKDGANYYNVFDAMVAPRLNQGETHTVMVQSNTSNGKTFLNIVGLAPDEPHTPPNLANLMPGAKSISTPPAKTTTPAPTQPKEYIQDPMIDVRKTSLSAATALLAADMVTMKGFNQVLRKFENYLLNGLSSEQIFDTDKTSGQDLTEFVAHE